MKNDKLKAIVAFEPGSSSVFPEISSVCCQSYLPVAFISVIPESTERRYTLTCSPQIDADKC
jgi:hypothetical protein